jgi:hypothetical protein
MTPDAARAYVKRWSETGRLLERQRWDLVEQQRTFHRKRS